MAGNPVVHLGRRERAIMESVYRRGSATVSDVRTDLDDPPSYSAVRAMLHYLEGKGHLRHCQDGRRFDYYPTIVKQDARLPALRHLVRTFFDGSISMAVAALADDEGLPDEEIERLSNLIDRMDGE